MEKVSTFPKIPSARQGGARVEPNLALLFESFQGPVLFINICEQGVCTQGECNFLTLLGILSRGPPRMFSNAK